MVTVAQLSVTITRLSVTITRLSVTVARLSVTVARLSVTVARLSVTIAQLSVTIAQLSVTIAQLSVTITRLVETVFVNLYFAIIGTAIFIILIGVLQLRQDDRLTEKSFVDLVKMVMKQFPLIGNLIDMFQGRK